MKHHSLRLGLILVVLSASSACSIKEPPSLGEKCPPSGGEFAYVLDSDGNKCEQGQACFEEFSGYGRCPGEYRCSYNDGTYYCYKGCGSDQIRCGDTCVNPKNSDTNCGSAGFCYEDEPGNNFKGMNCGLNAKCTDGVCLCNFDGNSKNHCGAKGLCSDVDPSSENYQGMDCGSRANCESGKCKCSFDGNSTLYCGAKGNCADLDPGSDNYEGMNCGEHSTCEAGKCECERDYEQCGGSDYSLCVDIKTDNNHCGGCNIRCEDGDCVDGHCIKNNCDPNVCRVDTCLNDDKRCGEQCTDCESSSKVCDIETGSCRGCKDNETYNQAFHKCIPNDVLDCGGVNCLDDNLIWNTISCKEGKCEVTCNNLEDNDGNYYHVNNAGDRCEKDSDTKCGNQKVDCTVKDENGYYRVGVSRESDKYATEVKCVQGVCMATACKMSDNATLMFYDYDSDKYFERHFDVDTPAYTIALLSDRGKNIGYYHHLFAPKNGKCVEINKPEFCGKSQLNCGADDCVGVAPGCHCVGTSLVCNECAEEDAANANSYCALSYHCGCPKGKHKEELGHCEYDTNYNCGGKGIVCNTNSIADSETVECIGGTCKVTKCKGNKQICNNTCVSSIVMCEPGMTAVGLDCGGGGIHEPTFP